MKTNVWVRRVARAECILLLLLTATLLSSAPCRSETTTPEILPLEKAIDIALRNQPTIEVRTGQARAAEARTGQARGGYYPRASVGTAYTRIWPVGAQTAATASNAGLPPNSSYIPTGSGSYEQYAATASLSQTLFDFGKTSSQVQVQDLGTQAARLELTNEREQVIYNVKEAYYRLLASERNSDVTAAAVKQFRYHLEQARSLYEVGSKPKFDVTKAEVDLSNAMVNLTKAENSVKLSRVALNNAMGMPDMPPYTAEEVPPSSVAEMPFDEAVKVAIERRPDLVALQKQKESANESIRSARKEHLPTFSGSAALTYVGTFFPLDHGWTAGLNMAVPLFNGFVTKYRVAEARANLTTASANERNLRQTIVLELQQGYLLLAEASERRKSAEIAVRQARENLDLANERYQAGLAIGTEVADAVVALANAEFNGVAAYYDHEIARARIDKALGVEPSL